MFHSSSLNDRETQLTRIKIIVMIKQQAIGKVTKKKTNPEGMSESLKYSLLNCVLILYVDSNWFTPRAKLKEWKKNTSQTTREIYL